MAGIYSLDTAPTGDENGGGTATAAAATAADKPTAPAAAAAKRVRAEDAPDAVFLGLLREVRVAAAPDGSGEFAVDDARRARRALERRLALNPALAGRFLEGAREHLAPPAALAAALRPLRAAGGGAPRAAAAGGDSLVRLLLSVAPLQAELAEHLVQRIPEFGDGGDGAGGPEGVPQAILAQFRWLDAVAEPRRLTAALLEALPVMPPDGRRAALALLPELAGDGDHGAVLDALADLAADAAYVPAALDALASLPLEGDAAAAGAALVRGCLDTARAEDLPAVVRALLAGAGAPAAARDAAAALRGALHFADAGDPRLAVPDRKQKRGAAPALEGRVLAALKAGLQASPAAADALLREVRGVTAPAEHRAFDLWALLLLLEAGGGARKAAAAALRRKFAEGHADGGWPARAIAGHAAALSPHLPALLGAARALVAAPGAPPRVLAGGAALYTAVFVHLPDAYARQEALRTLHSHLGAHAPAEAGAALSVLQALAATHGAELSRHAAFLTNILDHVERYPDAQVRAVFDVLAGLAAGACREAAGDGGNGGGGGGSRSRLEDELLIFLNKALAAPSAAHRRVGAVGAVALARRLAAAGGAAEAEGAALLDRALAACARAPAAHALLCDELAAAAGAGALGRRAAMDLAARMAAELEEGFVGAAAERPGAGGAPAPACAPPLVGGAPEPPTAWWSLEPGPAPATLELLPRLAAEAGAPPGAPAPGGLAALYPLAGLVLRLQAAVAGGLGEVDGLLSMPLAMFDPALVHADAFAAAGAPRQRLALLGLLHAAAWCRELVAAWAPHLGDASGDHVRVMARLRQAAQAEAALAALLPAAPPGFALPRLGGPPAGGRDAPPPAPKPKKASKGGAAAKGKAKKKAAPAATTTTTTAAADSTSAGEPADSRAPGPAAGGGAAGKPRAAAAARPATDAVRAALRELPLAALRGLDAMGAPAAAGARAPRCFSMLPAAAYLLEDAAAKLAALAAPAAGGAARFGRRAAGAGGAPGPAAAELLDALAPLFPAVRRHVDAALEAVDGELADDGMEAADEAVFWGAAGGGGGRAATAPTAALPLYVAAGDAPPAAAALAALPCGAAEAAASPAAAAERVLAAALRVAAGALAVPGAAAHRGGAAGRALVAALARDAPAPPPAEGECTPAADAAAAREAARFVLLLEPDDPEAPLLPAARLARWHAVLLALEALARRMRAAAEAAPPASNALKATAKIEARLRDSAAKLLGQRLAGGWGAAPGHEARRPLADALRLHLALADDPAAAVAALAAGPLARVPSGPWCAAARAEGVPGWPSLTPGTLPAWYEACWAALLARWRAVAASAAGAGAGADDEALAAIADGASSCARALRALLDLLKAHGGAARVARAALRCAPAALDAASRLRPFWAAVFEERRDEWVAVTQAVERSARVVQRLAADCKAAGAGGAALAPAAKRAVERHLFESKAFLLNAGAGSGMHIGELKHSSVAGRAVPSQVYREAADDDASDGGAEAEEEDDDEGQAEEAEEEAAAEDEGEDGEGMEDEGEDAAMESAEEEDED